jgi:hypothetical protein
VGAILVVKLMVKVGMAIYSQPLCGDTFEPTP